MSCDMENRMENNFLASENEREQLFNRIAELEQRAKVLTMALENIMEDQRTAENRYVFLTAKHALNQTPQQTAAQIERWHVEWMEKQLPYAWLWRFEEDEEWHLSVGPHCPTYRDECITVPLVAIPPFPKESSSPETDLDEAQRRQ